MGMDVYGLDPTERCGEYFRASIWSWPAFYALTIQLCRDLLDEGTIIGMAYNIGAGPKNAETCQEMAACFGVWMDNNRGDYQVYIDDSEETLEGRVLSQLQEAGWTTNEDLARATTRSLERCHLKAWRDFLNHCGGFEVW